MQLPVEITEALMPGVVSIPHGWGFGPLGRKSNGLVLRRRTESVWW